MGDGPVFLWACSQQQLGDPELWAAGAWRANRCFAHSLHESES